jgi:hypothetical protein
MPRQVGRPPEAIERRKARDRIKSKQKRDERRKALAAAAKAVVTPRKPNRHTLVFRKPVEMTKAEMYEMFATAAANTAAMR